MPKTLLHHVATQGLLIPSTLLAAMLQALYL
ncbi:hypothetical protein EMIT093MI4_10234 [Pseudomonas sp. IT-93MI4]